MKTMNVVEIQVKSRVQWQVSKADRGTGYVAVCEPLALTLEADSLDDLESIIGEALQLLFTDLFLDNEFHDFLMARGWRAKDIPEDDGDIEFQVPWQLLMNLGHDSTQSLN